MLAGIAVEFKAKVRCCGRKGRLKEVAGKPADKRVWLMNDVNDAKGTARGLQAASA
jgi:hypothetical protein